MVRLEPRDVRFFATSEDLRAWFAANHATTGELWLGYYKKWTGRPSITWAEAVDEALCVGWIDGILKRIDAESHVQRFTPRRKRSNWSAVNVANVDRLKREGRMTPAGLAAFEARAEARTSTDAHESTVASFTAAELASFQADAPAWADWQARSPSYRRSATHWVTDAKRPATRARRLAALIEASQAGRPISLLAPTRKAG